MSEEMSRSPFELWWLSLDMTETTKYEAARYAWEAAQLQAQPSPRAGTLDESKRMVNDLCEAISRIRWARGTDKLDAAIFEAVRLQGIADAGGYAHVPALARNGADMTAMRVIVSRYR